MRLKREGGDTMPDVLELFTTRTADWFRSQIGEPTPVQTQAWSAIHSGGHVLVSAPTGTGKTLSAFLLFIDQLKEQAQAGTLRDELYVLYISPLKALGNDIHENLRRPLEGIGAAQDASNAIRTAVRTGDTPQNERQRMYRKPPHILITTPESLYLLLTGANGRKLLKPVRAVIVDELHAVMNSKRGAHLIFSLARLDKLCARSVQRIGLSATVEPLAEAADFLSWPEKAQIVAPKIEKKKEITVVNPLPDLRMLPEGTIWPEIARSAIRQCEGRRTVIAFSETRAQAEKLAYYVNQLTGEDFARTHHGCVSKQQRLQAEQQLRSGELRLLCATSSMELGIDVGEVDLVLQIAYPRAISSAMQRLGRAGHNPGRTSEMYLFPRTSAEGLYCGLTATVALQGGVERLHPPRCCLDILAQHLVSMATDTGYSEEDALALARRAYNFKDITPEQVRSVLRMLAGDFEHDLDRPVRPRILYDRINGFVQGDVYSRMLATSSGGTIPDRGWFSVHLPDGTKLGELDEEYTFEARVGDRFLLGAFAWRIAEFTKDRVIVEPTSPAGARIPFWKGERGGRSYETGLAFGELMRGLTQAHHENRLYDALRNLQLDEACAQQAKEYIERQIGTTGTLPDEKTIILEHYPDENGENQMMVHSVFGQRVNTGLALLVQEAALRVHNSQLSTFEEDDGFLVCPFNGEQEIPEGLLLHIDPEGAADLLRAMLPKTPLFQIAFRYNVNRALLMGMRDRGRGRLPLWVQRMRSAQALNDAIVQQEHPLVWETLRECMEEYWDIAALQTVLRGIHTGNICLLEQHSQVPSPMSLPFRRQVEAALMYDYTPTPPNAHRSVQQSLEAAAMLPPDAQLLAQSAAPARTVQDELQLHSLLMTQGDLIAGETDALPAFFNALARDGRVRYIEPGLWIAAEHEEIYQRASEQRDEQARRRILKRCLRFRGAQDAQSLSERYHWSFADAQILLDTAVQTQEAVLHGDVYYHSENFNRAQRETVYHRRQQAKTVMPERYAALLCGKILRPALPQEQLRAALSALAGQAFPPAQWEEIILPARVQGYRAELLDTLLSEGEYAWRILPGERLMLQFYENAKQDWQKECPGQAADERESVILRTLRERGACFSQSLALELAGQSPLPVLFSLLQKGLVHADSFVPLRQWLAQAAVQETTAKQRGRSRVLAMTAGRWELTRPLREVEMEALLEQAFDRSLLLCRETAQGISWSAALEVLRLWEFTGHVRRGYFLQGLSGAQFIRDTDYARVTAALEQENPQRDTIWLNAVDPLQPWGKALPQPEGRNFICVAGTAVALQNGLPVAVLEQQGKFLRVFDPEALPQTLAALAHTFAQKRIFPHLRSITVKKYPREAVQALEQAGFKKQMLDYCLFRPLI